MTGIEVIRETDYRGKESAESTASPITRLPDPLITSVSSLSLTHFRNYTAARIEVSPRPVVLTGHNGAGKTNILEALSLLVPGRGLRQARLSEIGNRDHPQAAWTIAAGISGRQGEAKIGTGRAPDSGPDSADKRIVRIDEKPSGSQAELARHLSIVWLTPQMEQLFNDGASAGRKFLDRLVYSFDPEHASRVNEYEFAMRERNKLLAHERSDPIWLDALEQTMAETGVGIAAARLHSIEHLNFAIADSTLSFPKARISVTGIVEDLLALGTSALQAEKDFKSILKSGRLADAAAGRTLSGPHRSAMQVIHTEKQMPAEACSTGEQKALLLSIVLAEARSGARWHGVVPMLLLDEVITHLDATRRAELFEEILHIGAQVWMTGTDAALFSGLQNRAQFFRVEHGEITPSGG